jgi:hypothetical protein
VYPGPGYGGLTEATGAGAPKPNPTDIRGDAHKVPAAITNAAIAFFISSSSFALHKGKALAKSKPLKTRYRCPLCERDVVDLRRTLVLLSRIRTITAVSHIGQRRVWSGIFGESDIQVESVSYIPSASQFSACCWGF